MGHTVGFPIPRSAQIPSSGANRNFRAQQAPRFGPAPAPPGRLRPCQCQQPIQGGRAHLPHRLAWPATQLPKAPFVIRQPLPQDGHQTLAARLLCRQPYLPYHRLSQFILRFGSGMDPPAGRRQPAAQQFDRILALILVVLTQLVQHPSFALAVATRVTHLKLRQPILFQFLAHVHSHHLPVSFFHESTTLFASPQFHAHGVFNLSQLEQFSGQINRLILSARRVNCGVLPIRSCDNFSPSPPMRSWN